MRVSIVLAVLLGLFALATAKVYFQETFDDNWESRWVRSTSRESDGTQGTWDLSAGKYYNDAQADKGLHTTTDARFYQISAEIPEKFSNRGKDLIIQYSVKHEQRIDCGGAYIKLLPSGLNQQSFNGDSVYNIMFGPDICGSSTKKTHVIFTNKGKNHLVKREVKAEGDEFTHLYTLIVKPDNTYTVLIDSKEVQTGSLKEDFDILLPKQIKDPNAKKPSDWVDAKQIDDPTDIKPAGWDDIAAEIVDPDAKKPSDWDDELDGEWEAPTIDNPEYKGEWSAKKIENPAYKGEWVHPLVPNPDFVDDDSLYAFDDNKFVGFEIWQVKAGTIFDNIIVTDDVAEAEKLAQLTKATQEGEKKAHDKEEEERRAKEAEAPAHEEEADVVHEEKDEL
jgi:calreticulin